MIDIDISNSKHIQIEHVVFDVNGTLALDGVLLDGVASLIQELRQAVEVHMLTADTHGRQHIIDGQLGFSAAIIQGGAEKARYVQHLGADAVAAIGNGANDRMMCEAAALSIAVMGGEGVAAALIPSADLVVVDVRDALALLLNPNRIRATLRP